MVGQSKRQGDQRERRVGGGKAEARRGVVPEARTASERTAPFPARLAEHGVDGVRLAKAAVNGSVSYKKRDRPTATSCGSVQMPA